MKRLLLVHILPANSNAQLFDRPVGVRLYEYLDCYQEEVERGA
jgi:hypothetical protein